MFVQRQYCPVSIFVLFCGVSESVKKWKDKMQDSIGRNVHVVLSCFSGCQFQGVNNGGNVETVTRVLQYGYKVYIQTINRSLSITEQQVSHICVLFNMTFFFYFLQLLIHPHFILIGVGADTFF